MKRILALLLALSLSVPVSAGVYLPSHDISLHHQQNTASCWAHASVTLAETLATKSGRPASFSVDHLIANTTTGGGNPALFWEYALTRRGMLYEDLTPSGLRVLSHAEQNNADLAWVQKQIERFGAVTAQVAYPEDTGGTLYNPNGALPNHQIVLIGYDDGYSATNFSPAAPADGAFLAQNSYGAEQNNGGLLWISYYDATVLTQVEVATALVDDPHTYTSKPTWQTHALSATTWQETLTVAVPQGEILRSITLPHVAPGTEATLTVGTQKVQWHQQEEGSYTAYLSPTEGTLAVTLTLQNPEGILYRPADNEKNLVLIYGFAQKDAPLERMLLAAASPCEVVYEGKTYAGYQALGRKLIRLRDWADANGRGVLWEETTQTVSLTNTPNPTPAPPANAGAVAVISQSVCTDGVPETLYFIDGYQYLLLP